MSMILSGVALAAIGGGVGGLIGSGLAAGTSWIAERVTGRPNKFKQPMTVGFVVVCVIALGRLLPEILAPSPGDALAAANPEFAILQQYYPREYAEIVGHVQNAHNDAATLHNEVAPVISRIVAAHLKELDDDSAALMFDLAVAESRMLLDRDAISCLSMLNGGTSRIDLSKIMTPEMKQIDSKNTMIILQQVATRPAAAAVPLPPEEVRALAVTALNDLPESERQLVATVVRNGNKPATDAEAHAMCGFDINLFTGALHGPKGTVRRLIAAS